MQNNSVSEVLDDFHDAAAKADGDRYFNHFAEGAIFLGTDAAERWTVPEFKEFAKPYFDHGQGWTYTVEVRHIYFSADGNTAWFDEILTNKYYGKCRSAGVLTKIEGKWKIIQYNLSIPIPDSLAKTIVEMINNETKSE